MEVKPSSTKTLSLTGLPPEVWVDAVLPRAAEVGFLPGMLLASRATRELALTTLDRLVSPQANRVELVGRPSRRAALANAFPAAAAFAHRFERDVFRRGGPNEAAFVADATLRIRPIFRSPSVAVAHMSSQAEEVWNLFHGRPKELWLYNMELTKPPAALLNHVQLRILSLRGNIMQEFPFGVFLPNLVMLFLGDQGRPTDEPSLKINSPLREAFPKLRLISLDYDAVMHSPDDERLSLEQRMNPLKVLHELAQLPQLEFLELDSCWVHSSDNLGQTYAIDSRHTLIRLPAEGREGLAFEYAHATNCFVLSRPTKPWTIETVASAEAGGKAARRALFQREGLYYDEPEKSYAAKVGSFEA